MSDSNEKKVEKTETNFQKLVSLKAKKLRSFFSLIREGEGKLTYIFLILSINGEL